LEQSFNSLDAQREACEAYVASQKHEGWKLVPTNYDDGGLSGGTMNRPALQRLLADITAGRVDVVVVYKVDRLTRSLADFAKLTDLLDGAGASFVSVTQAFNTSTSMGRLTLNVLLSFAQFEREVAGERIRDKIAASKKRGMWMGGMPPLGYDVCEKQLIINQAEAATVQTIFERYLKLGTVAKLKAAMDAQGVISKVRIIKGKTTGGILISRNGFHTILKCTLYRGMIHHKGQLYQGNHQAIISEELWNAVQAQLAQNSSVARDQGQQLGYHNNGRNQVQQGGDVTPSLMRPSTPGSAAPNSAAGPAGASPQPSHLLTGLIFDEQGERLSPSHSTKRIKGTNSRRGGTRRYTYYVSASLVRGQSKPLGVRSQQPSIRLSATELDALVIRMLRGRLADRHWLVSISNPVLSVEQTRRLIKRGTEAAEHLEAPQARVLLQRVTIKEDAVVLTIDQEALAAMLEVAHDALSEEPISISQASSIVRNGRSTKLIIGSVNVTEPRVDQAMVDQLRQGHRWWQMLVTGTVSSITSLANTERVDASEISRTITLAFLDPSITRMILKGTQPPALTLDALRRARPLLVNWTEQRQLLLGKSTRRPVRGY
jgi:DNA invertase Pin-like site-specific DNA recombinase